MTYCLGILLDDGLVLASDSRSNAGVDDITKVRKMALFERPGERVIAVLSAGNLATTQSVVTTLQQAAHGGDAAQNLTDPPGAPLGQRLDRLVRGAPPRRLLPQQL